MHRLVHIPFLLALLLSACRPIVVRVGKPTQATEQDPSVSYGSEEAIRAESWNSVEDLLQDLDGIKRLGREALLRRYHENGRLTIRTIFREFRTTVEEHGLHDPSRTRRYLGGWEVGTCLPIKGRDVFDLGPYGDLRALLETIFLSKVKVTTLPDPEAPEAIDEITKLGFFELGIAMDGESYFDDGILRERQGSDLRWKVIHEQNEPEEWTEADDKGVQFRFERVHESTRDFFTLAAEVGPGVYESAPTNSLPSLHLDYERQHEPDGPWEQTLLMQTGLHEPSGAWQSLEMSRKIIVSQDIRQGRILHVTLIEHYKQADESEEHLRLDMDAQSLCSELGHP